MGWYVFPTPRLNTSLSIYAVTVVTGATDGIGREFAGQLASAGFNILIASRSQDKLDAFASELRKSSLQSKSQPRMTLFKETKYSVSTKTYAIDFSRRDANAYAGLATILENLDVGVLGESPNHCHVEID